MDGLIDLVVVLIVAGVCGALAQILFGFRRTNFLLSILIGVIGAYLGAYLAARLGLPSLLVLPVGASRLDIVWTVLGAALMMFVVSLVDGARRRPVRSRR
jgi:uncharacterized membrane protein YeaQ/YmgE (transglycosylase-associated protein family)